MSAQPLDFEWTVIACGPMRRVRVRSGERVEQVDCDADRLRTELLALARRLGVELEPPAPKVEPPLAELPTCPAVERAAADVERFARRAPARRAKRPQRKRPALVNAGWEEVDRILARLKGGR